MRKSKFTEEQIVQTIRLAESGTPVAELCRKIGISEQTFYTWRRKFWNRVRRICKLASVPLVCPHSLRGLHATLAIQGGATAESVARALGHGSFAMTARHYASEDSITNACASRVMNELSGTTPEPTDQLLAKLQSLDPKTRAVLMSMLAPQPSHRDDKTHNSPVP